MSLCPGVAGGLRHSKLHSGRHDWQYNGHSLTQTSSYPLHTLHRYMSRFGVLSPLEDGPRTCKRPHPHISTHKEHRYLNTSDAFGLQIDLRSNLQGRSGGQRAYSHPVTRYTLQVRTHTTHLHPATSHSFSYAHLHLATRYTPTYRGWTSPY